MAKSLYEIDVEAANGENKSLSSYKGDVLLIVNVASQCGLTPQYAGLEALNRKYKDRGLRVLGFPCNDFGGQEPGTIEEIQQFCSLNYDVSFELLGKLHCLGEYKHPLYVFLTGATENTGEIQWNFEKFLIGRGGEVLGRFSPQVTPEDPALVEAIERAL